MSKLRFNALELVSKRDTDRVFPPSDKVSDYFGENTFGLDQMRSALSADVFKLVSKAIRKGLKIDTEAAGAIA